MANIPDYTDADMAKLCHKMGKVLDAQNVPKEGRILRYWDGEKIVDLKLSGDDRTTDRR